MLGLLISSEFLLLEDFDFLLESLQVSERFDHGLVLILEVAVVRAGFLSLGALVLKVGTDPVGEARGLVGGRGGPIDKTSDLLIFRHQVQHLLQTLYAVGIKLALALVQLREQ